MKPLFILLLLLPFCVFAQELDATVTINTEKLAPHSRDRLSDFAETVRDYLNNNRYTGDVWEYNRIKCQFSIFFVSGNDDNQYTAQVSVSSIRDIDRTGNSTLMFNVLDNNWEFTYERGQSMYFNLNTFNSLTSFLDFYALMILGLDADSYAQLGGTQLFSEALNIAVLGANSSTSKGWEKNSNVYNKRVMVEEALTEKYRQFRENYFDYHYNGLDLLNKDKETALENMAKLVKNLEQAFVKKGLRGVFLKVFFDAKSGELANYLKDYPDKDIFKALKRVDPPHTSKYDEALGGS